MQAALEFHLVTARHAAEAEARVGQPAGLHHLGLGDAQLGKGRLQAAVVEQGDLHGSAHLQGLGQQGRHARGKADLIGRFAGPVQRGWRTEALLGELAYFAHATVGAEVGAAVQGQQGQEGNCRHSDRGKSLKAHAEPVNATRGHGGPVRSWGPQRRRRQAR